MSNSKIITIVLAACGGLGILMIAACAGLGYFAYTSANSSVGPEIDRLFAAIDNEFAQTYETQTTAEFRKGTSKQHYADIGNAVRIRLGRLKTKSLEIFSVRQLNAVSYSDVEFSASFERGDGTITAKMKKEGGQWKLVSFRVSSPAFDPDLASANCPKCGAPHARDARFCPSCGAALVSAPDNPAEETSK